MLVGIKKGECSVGGEERERLRKRRGVNIAEDEREKRNAKRRKGEYKKMERK